MTVSQNTQLVGKLLSGSFARSAMGLLQTISSNSPALLKYVIGLLLLINIRSWPLVWHYRVLFLPIWEIRARYYALLARTFLLPKQQRLAAKDQFLQHLCPVGEDPIKFTVSVQSWAGPDDCDFNWHLSNSSYPKHLDWARFRGALRMCPTFYRAGGWVPLGATHFKFIREIPMFAKFEIRMNAGAWDNKWLFIVIRFVTPKKSNSKSKKPQALANGNGHASSDSPTPSGDSAPFPALHTPAQPSDTITPQSGSGTTTPAMQSSTNPAERIAQLIPTEEPDGATLHCVSISELCFKMGRITVPPAIALACEGFSAAPSDPTAKPYSHANPPPHFLAAQAMQKKDMEKGHLKTLQKFFKNGWKDVPEGQRWWEDALGGEVEERRKKNLEAIYGVRSGMDGAALSSR